MRPIAVKLIQSVSNGLDPYEATHQFVHLMQEFYQQSFASTQKVITLLRERNLLVQIAAVKGHSATLNEEMNRVKEEIKAQPFVRNVLKRPNGIEILEVDLEIIAQQKASTVIPPRELLDLGMSIEEMKWTLLKV